MAFFARCIRTRCLEYAFKTSRRFSTGVDFGLLVKRLSDRFLIKNSFPDTIIKTGDFSMLTNIPPIIYAGFDPTGPSLHAGHLLVVNALLHFWAAGFEVIVLVGGATAKVGDPSERSTSRAQMDFSVVDENTQRIATQLDRLFKNFSLHIVPELRLDKSILKPVRFVNNAGWYEGKNAVDFMCEVASKFPLSHLLSKESVKQRVHTSTHDGLNFAELSYQIFQAYDWLKLYEDVGCLVQIGGSDQMGNINSGAHLIKKIHQKEAYGFTVPLLMDEEGRKFGKSNVGAVKILWLDEGKTSPFELYQHILRLPDSEVAKYLHLLTFYPLEKVEALCQLQRKDPGSRPAQQAVADQVTLLAHGADGLASAKRCTEALFKGDAQALAALSEEDFEATFKGVPTVEMVLRNDTTVYEILMALKHFPFDNLAEKSIRNGGFSINYQKIRDPQCVVVHGVHILQNNASVVRVGKKDYYLVRWK